MPPGIDLESLAALPIPMATGWLLGACMEARGKQDLWLKPKPELLAVLHPGGDGRTVTVREPATN